MDKGFTIIRDPAEPGVILKVANDSDATIRLQREWAFLRQYRELRPPITIPNGEMETNSMTGKSHMRYEFLTGASLEEWLRVNQEPRQATTISTRLAAFLVHLHSVEVSMAVGCGIGVSEAKSRYAGERSLCVLHYDVHQGNFLVLPNGNLAALDWTNLAIGDPASEFRKLLAKVPDFGEEVLDKYLQARKDITNPDAFRDAARRYLWDYVEWKEGFGLRADA